MSKWPRGEWGRPNVIVQLQQDAAPSHISPQDPALLLDFRHLGSLFFCALQSQFYRLTPGNAGEIIQCVQQAYNAYDKHKINRIWLTLMGCLNEIIEHHGNIDYQNPHIAKDRFIRLSQLPIAIPVCDLGLELCGGLD
jgi:hypothetical protein